MYDEMRVEPDDVGRMEDVLPDLVQPVEPEQVLGSSVEVPVDFSSASGVMGTNPPEAIEEVATPAEPEAVGSSPEAIEVGLGDPGTAAPKVEPVATTPRLLYAEPSPGLELFEGDHVIVEQDGRRDGAIVRDYDGKELLLERKDEKATRLVALPRQIVKVTGRFSDA
ncbi:MAG: hypothetical protein AB7Q29_16080 [Vicinamibacterales bacterium]